MEVKSSDRCGRIPVLAISAPASKPCILSMWVRDSQVKVATSPLCTDADGGSILDRVLCLLRRRELDEERIDPLVDLEGHEARALLEPVLDLACTVVGLLVAQVEDCYRVQLAHLHPLPLAAAKTALLNGHSHVHRHRCQHSVLRAQIVVQVTSSPVCSEARLVCVLHG